MLDTVWMDKNQSWMVQRLRIEPNMTDEKILMKFWYTHGWWLANCLWQLIGIDAKTYSQTLGRTWEEEGYRKDCRSQGVVQDTRGYTAYRITQSGFIGTQRNWSDNYRAYIGLC